MRGVLVFFIFGFLGLASLNAQTPNEICREVGYQMERDSLYELDFRAYSVENKEMLEALRVVEDLSGVKDTIMLCGVLGSFSPVAYATKWLKNSYPQPKVIIIGKEVFGFSREEQFGLFAHEIAHFLLGHVDDYLADDSATYDIDEFAADQKAASIVGTANVLAALNAAIKLDSDDIFKKMRFEQWKNRFVRLAIPFYIIGF